MDDVGSGKVNAGLAIPCGNISRDNVAAALVAPVEQPQVKRIIIELTDGDILVDDAIKAFG